MPNATPQRRQNGRGSRGTGAGPAGPKPTPLGDLSNSSPRPAAALTHKPVAASPALRAVAPPPLPPLPGLEEDGLQAEPRGRLPVTGDSFEAFGDALGCLRVTSLTRSASARRRSLLRLVQQPGQAEGRRSHGLPPEARPLLRAQTQPLPDGGTVAHARGRRGRGGVGRAVQACSGEVVCDSSDQPPPAPEAASSPDADTACGDMLAESSATAIGAGGSSRPDMATAPSVLPPPLPVLPGGVPAGAGTGSSQAAAAAGEQAGVQQEREEQASGSEPAAAEQLHRVEAVFCGLSAADEAAALPSEAPQPAWLRQQDCTNVTGERAQPCPALSVQAQQAAAVWRAQWVSGLQVRVYWEADLWHNAVRAGGPLRSGSKLRFIPLDPNGAVLEVLMFRAAVMPQDVVAGAARFQDIVLSKLELHSQALEEGVLRYGLWGVPCGGGAYTLMPGQLALPLSFRGASPEMLALFLACVWTEANSHETAQALAYSFGAGGERAMDESLLKYPASELHEWLHLAAGAQRPAAATAALAALRRIAVFGTE